MDDKLRIDKYLWAIRVFKTRTQAAVACGEGKVRSGDHAVKASHAVVLGDVYDVRAPGGRRRIAVTGLLYRRAAAAEAAGYYRDQTPPEWKEAAKQAPASFYTGKRQSKVGRPTKRSRRDLDDFLGDR